MLSAYIQLRVSILIGLVSQEHLGISLLRFQSLLKAQGWQDQVGCNGDICSTWSRKVPNVQSVTGASRQGRKCNLIPPSLGIGINDGLAGSMSCSIKQLSS